MRHAMKPDLMIDQILAEENLTPGSMLQAEHACPICERRTRRLLSRHGRHFERLDTVICTGCGLIHSHPIPSQGDLEDYYRETYRSDYKSTRTPKLKHLVRYAPGVLARVFEIQRYTRPDQRVLLDIGSGCGDFLYMATKLGFQARGIEPHQGYAAFARSELGMPVENASFETTSFAPGAFDVINLHHVLEHMSEPVVTLRRLHTLLREDGLLAIAVPDISLGAHAPMTQFHRAHIYNYNHETLTAVLSRAGFKVLNPELGSTSLIACKVSSARDTGPRSLPHNYEALWSQLGRRSATRHYLCARPYRRFIKKLLRYPAEKLLAARYRTPRKILDACFSRSASPRPPGAAGLSA